MIPGRSCQDGCWADPREGKKKKLNLENQKLRKVKTPLAIRNKIESQNPK